MFCLRYARLCSAKSTFRQQADELQDLLSFVGPEIQAFMCANADSSTRVSPGLGPTELAERFDFDIPQTEDSGLTKVKHQIQKTLKYSVRSGHPLYFKQLVPGSNPVGLIGDLLISAINTPVHVFESSPVLSLAEISVIRCLNQLAGFAPESSGMFCPGGTNSILTAVGMARHRRFPEVKQRGWTHERPVMVTSEHSHYAGTTAAQIMGLGSENVLKVRCLPDGSMDPQALKEVLLEAQHQDKQPFYVQATSGTTVLGAFDNLAEICRVVQEVDPRIWVHCDASWGGSALFSPALRDTRMAGLAACDSFNLNAHKALGVPLMNSVLLVNGDQSNTAHTVTADYLYTSEAKEFDLGRNTLQCGRRADGFRFWLFLQRYGLEAMTVRSEVAFANIQVLVTLLKEHPRFHLIVPEPNGLNVCFYYLPSTLSLEDPLRVSQYNSRMLKVLNQRSKIMVQLNPIGQLPPFFRVVQHNTCTTPEHWKLLVQEIQEVGDQVIY